MKKFLLFTVASVVFFLLVSLRPAYAVDPVKIDLPVNSCTLGSCPNDLMPMYQQLGEPCVDTFDTFKQDPYNNHYWIDDPLITAQGKADERARQFVYWALNRNSVDYHPTILGLWNISRDITFFLLLVVAAVMGIGMIIAQRTNFLAKIEVWPSIFKLLTLLLYVFLSAAIVITIIQLSDLLMKFFIETVGGKNLFNIYFSSVSQEENYVNWVGCRDLNFKVQEGIDAELFLLRATNVTYYVMGTMVILRKILLWFLLFVSPFLAILMPFVFIRNIGWIWIGVFFQWVFYGPLFALFLGALERIWKAGIPFNFDFSRVLQPGAALNQAGYIYPTGINIVYGGPTQYLWGLNNGNYIDTFVEYVITLIMLWAVIFFPWWLLRIFRDYCCDGIYAMKNILLSMYDQMHGGPPPPPPGPIPTPSVTPFGTALKMPKEIEIPIHMKLQTIEEIKKAKTEEITRSLSLHASKLTDIARFETNKQEHEIVKRNLNFLQNPTRAETPNERQKYMNIRSELFSRAIKEDHTAKQILSSISTSRVEQVQRREELLKTVSQPVPVIHVISVKVKIPQHKVQSATSNILNTVTQNNNLINTISQVSNTPQQLVRTILSSYTQNVEKPFHQVVNNLVKETNVSKEKVVSIIKTASSILQQAKVIENTARKETLQSEKVSVLTRVLSKSVDERITQPVSTILTQETGIPGEKVLSTTKTFLRMAATNPEVCEQIKKETGVSEKQMQTIIEVFTDNLHESPTTLLTRINQQTSIEKPKVAKVVTTLVDSVNTPQNIIKEVAQKENIEESTLHTIIQDQALVTEPEKNIEQSVSIPPTVSLEDYEEVKRMWKNQYEKGEVPVTENIQSRDQWLDQDIVFITNTLNKLVSDSPDLRQEGLDDVGYILPIFLINNLKGEELMVYLKAKIEAAKEVRDQIEREEALTEKLKTGKEEELVQVEKPKAKEKEKVMEMKEEIKDEPATNEADKKPDTPGQEKDLQNADTQQPEEELKKNQS